MILYRYFLAIGHMRKAATQDNINLQLSDFHIFEPGLQAILEVYFENGLLLAITIFKSLISRKWARHSTGVRLSGHETSYCESINLVPSKGVD